jgi:hypothetical protein
MSDNNLHDVKQSAYRRFHSTETLLTKVHDDVMTNSSRGDITMLVLLDLSAAFDTIDHRILIDRLSNTYGIKGTALDWFRSYVSNRTQSIIINETVSEKKTLKYGVPQGSRLGPVLFNAYIAPISEVAQSCHVDDQKYADDEQLILAFKPSAHDASNAKVKMEHCIGKIRQFLHNNKLSNNGDKTEVILLGPKSHLQDLMLDPITIDNTVVKFANDVKNLGVFFDRHICLWKSKSIKCARLHTTILKTSHRSAKA